MSKVSNYRKGQKNSTVLERPRHVEQNDRDRFLIFFFRKELKYFPY